MTRFGVVACLLLCGLGAPAKTVHAADGEPVRITDDGYLKQRPHWSPDGKWVVFARHRGADIFLFLRDTRSGEEQRLTEHAGPEYDAVFSPDGKQLLFGYDKVSPNQGDIEVYRITLEGRELTPVAVTGNNLSHEESPAWSPDGKTVAFTSTRDGNQELYTVPLAGGDWTRLTSDPAIDAHPAWSPDGRTIAFATNRWGGLEIALVNPDGTNLRRLTESPGLDDYPAWSPDGRYLAFTSNRDGNLDIFVATADGSNVVNVTRDPAIDNFPAWTPDGQIGFVSNRDGGFDLWVVQPQLPR